MEKKHYGAIDGLRSFSAIGIILMHVAANTDYHIDGFVYNRMIPFFTNFVFLFMIISAFGMCCGYYDKMINNKIAIGDFYSKRYKKIWPYFAFVCLLDLLISPSIESLYEVFANLTLCFGLLPNAGINVIGVGWFLGVVFIFYLLFPFFCWLLQDKKRAWFSFVVMLIFNWLCTEYFFDTNHVIEGFDAKRNFIYCAVFFMAGGLIFLYKEPLGKISEKYRWGVLGLCLAAVIGYFCVSDNIVSMMLVLLLLLIYALGVNGGVLLNPVTRFLSSISMEIYLCHMIVFRIIEKAGVTHLFGSDVLNYILTACATIVGAIVFAVVVKKGFELVKKYARCSF